MTVPQKWCLKTSNNHTILPLHPRWICSVIFPISTNHYCTTYIYAYFFTKNVFLDVVSVSHTKHTLHYVTKWIYNKYLKTIYNWLTFLWVFLILKLHTKVSTHISLKTNNKKNIILYCMFIYVSTIFESKRHIYIYIWAATWENRA